ncbi:MAG: hypothetical protein DI539_02715 [Flavobacterium psychrophilum]|nr:MAG: hypothetical protein DI539_02715 [Flavobacterium psychrophilum]
MSYDVIDYLNYKKVNYASTYKANDNIPGVFNVRIYPTTILYDKNGNLIRRDEGYRKGGANSLRRMIKKALK